MIEKQDFGGFFKKEINGELLHLIKFREFASGYKAWAEANMSPEYKIKDTMIKQKLMNMNNSFAADRSIRRDEDGKKKKEKFACFNMEKMKIFLDEYIFANEEQDSTDVGAMEYIPKKPSSSSRFADMLDSK